MNASQKHSPPRFILLGASLGTGNLGVSALLAATVKCIRRSHPDAIISILEASREARTDTLTLGTGEIVTLGCVGVRRNKTVWRRNHLLRLLLTVMVLRLVPVAAWRQWLLRRNAYLSAIASADCVADITGGDSFSDIYGLRRLIIGTMEKMLVILAGADLILLPQTYGPFRTFAGRLLARIVLSRAAAVYTRDCESLKQVQHLTACRRMRTVPRFSPDMAFVLDAVPPKELRISPGPLPDAGSCTLIGLNVNGLLYNGGYTRDNMFGLKADYRSLVRDLARALLARRDTALLLIPHVFVPAGHVESDCDACRDVFEAVRQDHPGRVFLLEGTYDQSEIKHVIGRCSFFIGSRMHACIAAASQCIPTVPLAYSRKFAGVFESIGQADATAHLGVLGTSSVLEHVMNSFDMRKTIADCLQTRLPLVRRLVLSTFGADGAHVAPKAAPMVLGTCY